VESCLPRRCLVTAVFSGFHVSYYGYSVILCLRSDPPLSEDPCIFLIWQWAVTTPTERPLDLPPGETVRKPIGLVILQVRLTWGLCAWNKSRKRNGGRLPGSKIVRISLTCSFLGNLLQFQVRQQCSTYKFIYSMYGNTFMTRSSRVNCCWSSPAQSFSVPAPPGFVTIFFCLATLEIVQLLS
jgi:hypothetical protein